MKHSQSKKNQINSIWNINTNTVILVIVIISFIIYALFFQSSSSSKSNSISAQEIFQISAKVPSELTQGWLLQQQYQFELHEKTDENSQFIHGLTTNSTKLTSFDPFGRYNEMNVWDIFPPILSCPDLERIGKVGEGGKWVCAPSFLEHRNHKKQHCVVYSFGVSFEATFDEEFLKRTHCEMHAFDPSVGNLPKLSILKDGNIVSPQNTSRKIWFHKAALGVASGPSELHAFSEHLYDTMHRLRHPFIDILKVDIEGGEWGVFDALLNATRDRQLAHQKENRKRPDGSLLSGDLSSQGILPVGQILIELHYSSMPEISSFFSRLRDLGFLPYSREINLIPTLTGGKPMATEYSFINTRLYFADRSQLTVPAPFTPEWHQPIRAVIYYLTRKNRVGLMSQSLLSLYENFWMDYPFYPVVIFHDDLEDKDKRLLQSQVPHMPLTFKDVRFAVPSFLDPKTIPPRMKECSPDTSTFGYRHMCRFHAFQVHDLLLNSPDSEFRDVEFIFRLDDDGLLSAPIGYDIFRFMKANRKLYGFINIISDEGCVDNLWNHTKQFLNQTRISLNPNTSFFNSWTESNVFYNNFEVSHSSLWRHPLWKAFSNYIDQSGGIYFFRWGDAPLHTIGVSLVASKLQTHSFKDVGYKHAPFLDQAARGLPYPKADPFHGGNCDYYLGWTCAGNSNHSNVSSAHQFSSVVARWYSTEWENREKGVLFSFGHPSREVLIASSINNLFDMFARRAASPFVIFYANQSQFSPSLVQDHLHKDLLGLVTFQGVYLPSVLDTQDQCAVSSSQVMRSASYFMRFAATRVLSSLNKDWDWYFRFSDDSHLFKHIPYNIFDRMANEKRRYGFIHPLHLPESCAQSPWSALQTFCEGYGNTLIVDERYTQPEPAPVSTRQLASKNHHRSHHKHAASTLSVAGDGSGMVMVKTKKCSSLQKIWPPGLLAMGTLEVSHKSVWESEVCRAFESFLESGSPVPNHTYFPSTSPYVIPSSVSSTSLWGDSLVHTACVILSLRPDEIIKLDGIGYEAVKLSSLVLAPEKQNSTQKSSSPPSDQISVQSKSRPDLSGLFNRHLLPDLDSFFQARRLGWLGADVSTSLALPMESEVLAPGFDLSAYRSSRYLWLFGDTLIGTSDKERRIAANFVSNTVGLLRLSHSPSPRHRFLRHLEKLDYYWNSNFNSHSATDAPAPIFSLSTGNAFFPERPDHKVMFGKVKLYQSKPGFWPLSGVSLVPSLPSRTLNPSLSSRLIILGPAVIYSIEEDILWSDIDKGGSMGFTEGPTALVTVLNPHAAPQAWEYKHSFFPTSPLGEFRWFEVSPVSGAEFLTSDEDKVYLIGNFAPKGSDKKYNVISSSDTFQILARASVSDLLRHDLRSLEVLFEDKLVPGRKRWLRIYDLSFMSSFNLTASTSPSHFPYRPLPLFSPKISEGTLQFDSRCECWLLSSFRLLDTRFQVCRSDSEDLERASWTCALVAEFPHPWNNSDVYNTYAGKSHPGLIYRAPGTYRQTTLPNSNPLPPSSDSTNPTSSSPLPPQPLSFVLSMIPNTLTAPALYDPSHLKAYTPKFLFLEEKAGAVEPTEGAGPASSNHGHNRRVKRTKKSSSRP